MGFVDRILGGRQQEQGQAETPVSTPEPPSSRELLRDTAPSTSLSLPQRDKLYDPYDGISQAIGGKKAVFRLPQGPEFVFAEEAAVHRRSWGENLQYYTGLGYLGGGTAGMLAGAVMVAKQRHELPAGSTKLLANRLLNQSGHLGRKLGNGAGVLGLYFSCLESFFHVKNEGMLPDTLVTALAGFTAAAIFRSPRGPKAAAIAGGVGSLAAAGLAGMRSYFPSL